MTPRGLKISHYHHFLTCGTGCHDNQDAKQPVWQFQSDVALRNKAQKRHEETLKWRDLPTGKWYSIQDEQKVVTKKGMFKILTLESREGDIIRVWSCSTHLKEKGALQGAYLCSHGLKKGKSGYRYFAYELARM